MNRWLNLILGGSVGFLGLTDGIATAQTVTREREVSVTGPGGRTLERSLSATRGPGYIDRRLSVSRPGGTLERSVQASAAPAFRGGPPPGPGWGHRPGPWFGPPPPSGGGGMNPLLAFGLGGLTGAAVGATVARATAPPPVVIASPPLYVQQPAVVTGPMVVTAPAVVSAPTVIAAPPVVIDPLDPVTLAAQRLQSYSGGTRREAAESLGLLGDPRGIPPLVDVLKNDWNSGVRSAAAESLGKIGGPEAEAVLGRAVVFEKKEAVREAAAHALHMAQAKSAALATALPAETVIESRVESLPRTAAVERRTISGQGAFQNSTPPPPPSPAAARPSAWLPSPTSSSISLEGPDEVLEPTRDRIPPPPPSPAPG